MVQPGDFDGSESPRMSGPGEDCSCPTCQATRAEALHDPALWPEPDVEACADAGEPFGDLDARWARFCEEMIEEVQTAIDQGVGGGCGSRRSLPLTTKGDLDVFEATTDVRLPVGSNGQVLTADSSQAKGIAYGQGQTELFGNGSDGNVTYNSAFTMTRDLFANVLTIGSSGDLDPRGHRIFAKKKVQIVSGGKIRSNGGAGGAGLLGVGGSIGSAGGGTTRVPFACLGRAGAAGGAGGGSGTSNANGSAGGAAFVPPMDLLVMQGGCGGGAGGGHGSAPTNGGEAGNNWGATGGAGGNASGGGSVNLGGGGGGGGGGVVVIFAREIDNAGSIEAKGGAGGPGESSGGTTAGNGGGGGGGAVVLTYATTSGSGVGTLSAAGGAAGAGGSGGAAGSAGTTASYQVSW